jgi:hypothetical protein
MASTAKARILNSQRSNRHQGMKTPHQLDEESPCKYRPMLQCKQPSVKVYRPVRRTALADFAASSGFAPINTPE